MDQSGVAFIVITQYYPECLNMIDVFACVLFEVFFLSQRNLIVQCMMIFTGVCLCY